MLSGDCIDSGRAVEGRYGPESEKRNRSGVRLRKSRAAKEAVENTLDTII